MSAVDFRDEISLLKQKRNAVILAHVYQSGEVQDIADFTGDSLDLSRKASDVDADVIVFCGVQFMAETAYLLNPNKTVLLPDTQAGCGLADMMGIDNLRSLKSQFPDAAIVSYVNSSAAIKAESDVCCTSANAVNVVNSLVQDRVIFVPDKNLGTYVAEQTKKNIILSDSYCYVHENITVNQLRKIKDTYPESEILVHPECIGPVRHFADFTGSTAQMSKHVAQSPAREFIIGTEINFGYHLKKDFPDKIFYPVSAICLGMKRITLESIKWALEHMEHKIMLDDSISGRARNSVEKMLRI